MREVAEESSGADSALAVYRSAVEIAGRFTRYAAGCTQPSWTPLGTDTSHVRTARVHTVVTGRRWKLLRGQFCSSCDYYVVIHGCYDDSYVVARVRYGGLEHYKRLVVLRGVRRALWPCRSKARAGCACSMLMAECNVCPCASMHAAERRLHATKCLARHCSH